MTVVIGLMTNNSIVFGSDGYAIYQDDAEGPVYKTDTYSKIHMIGENRYLLGSAGSHQIGYQLQQTLEDEEHPGLLENAFLDHLGGQIKQLNNNSEGKETTFLLGYLSGNAPQVIVFQKDGSYSGNQHISALGSGADLAMEYLSKIYRVDWKVGEAVGHMVDAIFASSRIPTVNFLPMISILSKDRSIGLSSITVDTYDRFKSDLKQQLIEKAIHYSSEADVQGD